MSSILSVIAINATIILYPQSSVLASTSGEFPTSSQLETDKKALYDALNQGLSNYQEGENDCTFSIIIKNSVMKVTNISYQSRRPECERAFKAAQSQTVKLITKEGLKGVLFIREEKL
ncbi:hypothetical protein KW516_08805 [Vibrio fluvialis]|nr:hypothetical protein [Vibrio fluvialis]MBY8063978.1 hypothetical protein [Vibrio fluvialis]MBY8277825.1 hypothetical protein [Vibrio fluvialis]MBY8289893.1 hypothetical protein [Vibrio fluvialis]